MARKLELACDPNFVSRLAVKLMLHFGETFKDRGPLPTDLPTIEKWIDNAVQEEIVLDWSRSSRYL